MIRQELLNTLQARPFQPFRISLTDGVTYLIRHPDLVWVSPVTAYVGVPEGTQGGPAVERQTIIGLSHITRLEQLEQHSSSDN